MNKKMILSLLIISTITTLQLHASPKSNSWSIKSYSPKISGFGKINKANKPLKTTGFSNSKPYEKKAPNADLGKQSKVNNLPKTKSISGHLKKTNKGFTHVNSYARSK